MYYDAWLVIWYKNDTGSFRVIRYDAIQWLQINIATFFGKNRAKEKVCFCAVVEEVKQWKSSTHWTTQTFSSRPQFNLCGCKRRLKISCSPAASCRDPPLSKETLLTQHTRAERQRMTWSNLYNSLPLEREKKHPQNNVWREKYKALILNMDIVHFCFKIYFRWIQVILEGWFVVNHRWNLIVGI